MKKNNIFLIIIFLFMIISVVACSKKDVSTNENILPLSESAEIISEYTLDNEYFIDPNNVTCMKLIDSFKDGFVFDGIKRSVNNNFSVISYNYNDYSSREFIFDESDLNIESLYEYNSTIVTLSSFGTDYYICTYDSNGREINRNKLDYYPNDIKIKNNRIYILDTLNYTVYCYTMSLDELYSKIIDTDNNDNRMDPIKICISDNDIVYCLLSEKMFETGKIVTLGNNSITVRENINDIGSVEDLLLCSSGNLMVFGVENGIYMVDKISDDGKIIDTFEIEDCDKIYGITSSDHIIYSSGFSVKDFFDGEIKTIVSESSLLDLNVYNVIVYESSIDVYLNSEIVNKEAVIVADSKGKITAEYRTDYIVDSCVNGDIIYMINSSERNKYEISYIQNNILQKTNVKFENEIPYSISGFYDGKIIVYSVSNDSDDRYLLVFDQDFKLIKRVDTDIIINKIFFVNEKSFLFGNEAVYSIDSDLTVIKTDIDIRGLSNNAKFYPGNNDYNFIVSDGDLLLGNSSRDNLWIKIADVNILGGKKIDSAVIGDDGEIFINCITCIYRLHKNNNVSIADSKINKKILIACFDMNYDDVVASAVQMYNSQNGQKIAEIKKYKDISDNTALSQINADLLSGDIPDVIVWGGGSDIDSYLNKNLFADMNIFINRDSEYNRSDFNENILDAFMYNGKLMAIPLKYSFKTLMSAVKGDYNNFNEYMDYVIENVEPRQYFCGLETIDRIILYFLSSRITENKINISEKDMQKLIRFFNNYYCLDNETTFNNPVFLNEFEFGDLNSFYNLSEYMNMEELDIGYYDISGVVIPSLCFSITEKSEKKDEAWNFIKYLCRNGSLNNNNSSSDVSIMKSNGENNNSNITKEMKNRYNLLIQGKWINNCYNSNLSYIIIVELFNNPDMSVEEKSKVILKKIEKYYYETR